MTDQKKLSASQPISILRKSQPETSAPDIEEDITKVKKKLRHPFKIRLPEGATFGVDSPKALVNAGFASLGIGMFAIFRPTPFLIYCLAEGLLETTEFMEVIKFLIIITTGVWCATIFVVLIGFGILQTLSVFKLKRPVLMMHPWGLTLLYFDVLVWISLAVTLQLQIQENELLDAKYFDGIHHPLVIFIFIYLEVFVYFVGYYTYTTYFIAAELTLIEKYF